MKGGGALSRRAVLRGTGVALALPWLESLAPRAARAQAPAPRKTFVAFSFPEGTAEYWKPAPGTGPAWTLSPILEPLAPLKKKVTVLGNVGNYGPFGGHVEPSTSNLTGAYLTCVKPERTQTPPGVTVGTSVDQLVARALGAHTSLASLQVGLSTLDSYTDGLPPACARSISWASPTEPLFKLVSPQAVFDKLVAAGRFPAAANGGLDLFAAARRAERKSVLDFVRGHAASVRARLGRTDQARLDGYLSSVRDLETRVDATGPDAACAVLPRPTEVFAVGQVPASYNRGAHADLMIDLVVMALQCDVTRVVSFMLDDSRSDFVYNFLTERKFTDTGSTLGTAPCGGYDGLTHAGNKNNAYATVNRWFVEKLARLCQKLDAVDEGGATMLDNATVWFGSEMHGSNNDALDLPVLYVGGGAGRLKTDLYVDFATTARKTERLANVYLTLLRNVFDLPVTTFGMAPSVNPGAVGVSANALGAGTDVIPEILA
jgi:hypothetical protein